MAQPIYLDGVVWLSWGLSLLLTLAVIWLNIVPSETIMPAFVIMMLGGWAIIAVARSVGMTKGSVFNAFFASVALFLMWVETIVAQEMFSVSYAVPGDGMLVGLLFAIYEENLFLGFAVAGNAAGLPGIYIIIAAAVAFVPLHALAQPDDPAFNAAAFMVRCTLTGMTVYTRQAGPAFAAHVIWNVVMLL
jgi:hypothetical protein